jgi:hypothetical protein
MQLVVVVVGETDNENVYAQNGEAKLESYTMKQAGNLDPAEKQISNTLRVPDVLLHGEGTAAANVLIRGVRVAGRCMTMCSKMDIKSSKR